MVVEWFDSFICSEYKAGISLLKTLSDVKRTIEDITKLVEGK